MRRLLPLALTLTLTICAVCAALAWLTAITTRIPPTDAYLATTPGGINAVLATAVATRANVPLISGVQSLRLFAMVLIAPPLIRWVERYRPPRTHKDRALVEALGIGSRALAWRDDPGQWPLLRRLLATAFAHRPRDDWAAELPPDACVVPVLELGEALSGAAYTVHAGIPQPVPGPHFGRTPAGISRPAPEAGQHTAEVLASYGVPQTRVETLAAQGVICRERQAAS